MQIVKGKVITNCNELLTHDGWHEIVKWRSFCSGVPLRTFVLDCGEGIELHISKCESISISLTSLASSASSLTIVFSAQWKRISFRSVRILDCDNKLNFYSRLYDVLCNRFPVEK